LRFVLLFAMGTASSPWQEAWSWSQFRSIALWDVCEDLCGTAALPLEAVGLLRASGPWINRGPPSRIRPYVRRGFSPSPDAWM